MRTELRPPLVAGMYGSATVRAATRLEGFLGLIESDIVNSSFSCNFETNRAGSEV
jgi:hypothetical protein